MKTAFYVVLTLTLLPVLLGLSGGVLSSIGGCSGMDHIEHCAREDLFTAVVFLNAFASISMFVVPVGVVALIALGILLWLRRKPAAKK